MGVILIQREDIVTYGEVEIGAQIEVLPTQAQVHTTRQIRMRVTDEVTVGRVDLTIVVDIFHLELTYILSGVQRSGVCSTVRQYGLTGLVLVVAHLILALVDTVEHITVEHTYGVALHHDVHVRDTCTLEDTCLRTDLRQFVLVVREVDTYRVVELTHLVTPLHVQVNTLVLHVTDIDFRLAGVTCQCRPVRVDQHTRGLLQVPVEVHCQTLVECGCIETDVQHLRGLPLRVEVTQRGYTETGLHVRIVTGDAIEEGITRTILERPVVSTDVGVTGRTVASTQLEVIQILLRRLHELLVRHTPTQRDGGEGTPAVLLRELRRSVSTNRYRSQILALVRVVRTTEDTEHGGNTVHVATVA